jgi:putative tryptophan/tyrosine transport system substrate-binding protein
VMAYLSNPSNPAAELGSKEALGAASALGIRLHILNASTEQELDEAFAALVKLRADGLVVPGEPFFDSQRNRIVALAAQHSVATTYVWRKYVAAGGLISYGPSLTDSYRQAGVYAGRILKGDKAGDLPVVQPTKFELVVNLRTAKALGLEVPARLQERADEVIG